jgi:hypothetical protein
MTMTLAPLFAAGLFDSPWVILLVILGTPLINWLTKKREEAKLQQAPTDKKAGSPEDRAAMAELLRQLMGEPPSHAPSPPPLPAWDEDEDGAFPSVSKAASKAQPPPPGSLQAITRQRELANLRFKQLQEQGRNPAVAVGHGQGRLPNRGKRGTSPWRDRKKARQAFVASLVFAPPKGLEL